MNSPTLFDLHDPEVIIDPYPHYARLRDTGPVHRITDPDLWLLSHYDDVLATLRDHARFSSDLGGLAKGMRASPFNPAVKLSRPVAVAARFPWLRVLLTSDPPEHTVLRRKVSRAFTPRMMSIWEERIREVAERLVEDAAARARRGEAIDLVAEVATPLPTTVIAEMMGVPAARSADFKRWSDDLTDGLVGVGSRLKMSRSALAIILFFARTIRKRRRQPGDDLVSLLISGDKETALNPLELVLFCILLLVAGNETTTNLIANAMLALFAHPEVQRDLEADPSLAAKVIEETLRYDSPAQGLLRVAVEDVTIGSSMIPAGSKVLPLVGSANRDPGHWNDPDGFRLDRETSEHLAFGTGIHFCIGSALARLEGRIALETLFDRVAHISPAGEPERIQSPVLRGLRSLPVQLDVRSGHESRQHPRDT